MQIDAARILALLSALFFGIALILTQFGLRYLSPRQGAQVALPLTTVLLGIVAVPLVDWRNFDRTAAALFAAVGLLFPGVVTILTYEANRRMGPAVAGALGNLAPLFAVPLAAAMLNEIPSLLQGFGVTLVVVGVVILSADRRAGIERWPFWIILLPVTAAAIRGLSQLVIKVALASWPSPLAAILFGYAVSSCILLAVHQSTDHGSKCSGSRRGVLWFSGVAAANGTAVLAMYKALELGPVIVVSPLVSTYPLVTLMLATIVLRTTTPISGRTFGGVVLTVVGVILLIVG